MPVRCALLLKLFEGQLGTMHLGRLTQGEDAGRIVLLRELGSPEANAIAAQIDIVRSITHPKLIKLLCLGQSDANTYLVSEHVPGVALTELRSALRKQHTSVSPAVAVRITLDALRASFFVREVLCSMLGIDLKAAFHPDSIWLAEFGEVFATPVPGDVSSGRTPYSSSASNSAPGILMELATGLPPAQVLAQGLAKQLPEPIARVLARALAAHAKGQSDMETLMAEALSGLPAKLIATEAEVAQELERILGPRLHSRRLLLGVDQHSHDIPSEDDATFVTRLSAVENTPSGDEPTHIFRPYSGREADPDGATECSLHARRARSKSWRRNWWR